MIQRRARIPPNSKNLFFSLGTPKIAKKIIIIKGECLKKIIKRTALVDKIIVHNNHSAPTAPVKGNNKPYIKSLSLKAEDFCK